MTTQAIATTSAAQKIEKLAALFQRTKTTMQGVAARHLNPERMLHIASVAASRNPVLLQCTPASILQACLQASSLGLEPSGMAGGAHLVPYWSKKRKQYEAQMIPDYRGLIDLALRSRQVTSIEARPVFASDEFEFRFGTEQKLTHVPRGDPKPDEMLCVYGLARLRNAPPVIELMTKAQIDAIRDRTPAAGSGPWVTDYVQMARKTVIKRLSNYIPRSPELARAMAIEEAADADVLHADFSEVVGEYLGMDEAEPEVEPTPETKVEALKTRLFDKAKAAQEEGRQEREPGEEG